jgi:hypothetical protein
MPLSRQKAQYHKGACMRRIDPEIWRDEFIIELDYFERLLWVGLITTVADDQGRLKNQPKIIKVEIFPCDDIPPVQIKEALEKFAQAKKILVYEVNDKSLIQIINWWKYQSSASWMGKSDYPPPDGWQDCYRAHGKGNVIETSSNWESKSAGFLPSSYEGPTYPLASRDGEINGEGEVEDDDEEEDKEEVEAEVDKSSSTSTAVLSPLEIYQSVTAQSSYPIDQSELVKKFESLLPSYSTQQEAISRLTKVFSKWVISKPRTGNGYYNPFNLGWVDWAIVDSKSKDATREKSGNDYIKGKYSEVVEH